ncbi:MAG TPA: hypothetical protein VHA33_25635 [Candidatus Angelobacter sp.]|jgi:hypothetical protein|nr:hypothetical protein [Candidatus Angelobacter sp.]
MRFKENDWRLQNLRSHKDYLEQIESDPINPLYDSVAQGLATSRKNIAQLEMKQRFLRGDSIRESLLNLFILLLLTILFSFVAGRLIVWHGSKAGLVNASGEDLKDWKAPFWALVLAPFMLQETREIITSVLAVDKSWFGWSSFCLSTQAWLTSQIMAFGVYVAIGYPACIIWCLSREKSRPKKLTMDAPDGAWGVGDYVLFAQTWSLLIFILLLVPTVLWVNLAIQSSISVIYLLPPFGLLVGAGVIAARFVWRAIKLRLMYGQEVQSLGSWSRIKAVSPPPDPTAAFLGAQWWSLPAVVLATITTFWVVIQWSGLDQVLKSFVFGASDAGP